MRIVHTLSLFLLALFVSIGTVKADSKPNPPTEFGALFDQIYGTSQFNVTLKWYGSTYDDSSKKATGYHIYMASGQTENESQFQLVATVLNGDSANWYYKTLTSIPAGTYTFFIKAFNNSGESNRTVIKVLTMTVSSSTSLRFTTSPGKTVNRGGSYYYNANVSCSDSSKNSHIRYKLINGPDGMTIDSITGEISWTAPNANKVVEVKILAYLDNDDSVKSDQSWTITVGEGNNSGGGDGCVYFVGNVHDTSGNAMNGTVKLYRIDSTGHLLDGVITVTVSNGHWSRRVPPGTYVLRTQGENFEYEWYNNAKEPSQAQQFTVDCGDTTEVNFEVNPLPQEMKYVFHGRVTDSETGNGVHGTVYFYPLVNGALGTPIVVQTNGDGNYEVQLSNRYSYIAKAVAGDDFLPLWFNNVLSSTQATVLVANENKNNINFALPRRQNYNNGFAGQLIDSASSGVPGRVVVYLVVTHNNDVGLQRVRSVETNASGNFTVNNLVPGTYVLQGVPNNHPFVAGYYKANEFAVFKWVNSTQLTLDSTTHTIGLMIKLRAGEGRRGIIKIKGHVDGNGGIAQGGNNQIQSVSPLAGVLVSVLDDKSVPVDYAITGADGNYEINEIALGANTVIVDRPGYTASTQNLNFDGKTFVVANNVQLEALVSSVGEELVQNGLLSPNPVSGRFSLNFESAAGLARISIVNNLGMEVYAGEQNLVNGQNSVVLNSSELTNGSYFVHITMGNASSTLKFNVLH